MRFLVDENLPVDVAELLQGEGHDVLYLAHTDDRGVSDQEVWQLATREERIIVTRDLGFSTPGLPRPPGLVLVRVPDTFTRDQIASDGGLHCQRCFAKGVTGAITVLLPGRVRVREL